jgi:hypothetical protein
MSPDQRQQIVTALGEIDPGHRVDAIDSDRSVLLRFLAASGGVTPAQRERPDSFLWGMSSIRLESRSGRADSATERERQQREDERHRAHVARQHARGTGALADRVDTAPADDPNASPRDRYVDRQRRRADEPLGEDS